MPYNLITAPWLPVLRADNSEQWIAPAAINQDYENNPVMRLNAPRADFNAALMQFLIALLQTAHTPENNHAWRVYARKPPTAEQLGQWFEPLIPAFYLDGDNARFMQDLETLAGQAPLPISALLIDTMGSKTHFVKDFPKQGLHPYLAAMSLLTLQLNAPSGGAGHRTSLRGGGPLTTLVLTETPRPLWDNLWLNVLTQNEHWGDTDVAYTQIEEVFPWMQATRCSDKESTSPVTSTVDVHPLQVYWATPRRIYLDFPQTAAGNCALSGLESEQLVSQYRTKNYGANYEGWQHPFSPHSISPDNPPLCLHPNGAINYRHWMGLISEKPSKKNTVVRPARVVSAFASRTRQQTRLHLWASGYDLDNMKPRAWYESIFPLYAFADDEQGRKNKNEFYSAVNNMIIAASDFSSAIKTCLKEAWFEKGDPRLKKADMAFIDNAFWHDTEADFYQKLQQLYQADIQVQKREHWRRWHQQLVGYSLLQFDRWADCQQLLKQHNPKRIAKARQKLQKLFYSKNIKSVLDLAKNHVK
ncbi:type I-E CRISPR-associated protein Cse1/CasA [Candidatus Venteria ishoeyi]|uniref:CRISPR system Cascade subunit CasA n=1 Tax=Candidatus Venteria ishoeyi TaxID=1899563 RepID=A0A1H6F5Q4_9GAMM|nr:type I-E CRISPR-associated protein Cse1/CasA [Candidatus Venteria ishoeyi]SEH05470.1 CRISPR system Cascade subunit CasA [Candidatus Venteria ishoeyi]